MRKPQRLRIKIIDKLLYKESSSREMHSLKDTEQVDWHERASSAKNILQIKEKGISVSD